MRLLQVKHLDQVLGYYNGTLQNLSVILADVQKEVGQKLHRPPAVEKKKKIRALAGKIARLCYIAQCLVRRHASVVRC